LAAAPSVWSSALLSPASWLFALLVEHWRYKPLKSRHPGPDWLPTDERFVDPESGKLVAVFYKPSTGERRYVAV